MKSFAEKSGKKKKNNTDTKTCNSTDNSFNFSSQGSDFLRSLLHIPGLKAKLKIGASSDPEELEADRVADAVVNGSPKDISISETSDRICTKSYLDSADKSNIDVHSSALTTNGHGRGLDTTEKDYFESRFNRNLGNVRIHDGRQAADASAAINARAFTLGNNIFLNSGEYDFSAQSGKKLMAHELAHTMQNFSKKTVRRDPKPGIPNPLLMRDRFYEEAKEAATKGEKWKVRLLFSEAKTTAENESIMKALREVYKTAIIFDPELFHFPEKKAKPYTKGSKAPEKPEQALNFDFLKFKFRWGNTTLKIDLPSSIKFHLPFNVADSFSIDISAETSGTFKININADLTQVIGVSFNNSFDASSGDLKNSISIYKKKKVQHYPNDLEMKSKLKKKGADVKTAIEDIMKGDKFEGSLPNDMKGIEKTKNLISAIADLYEAIDDIKIEEVKQYEFYLGTTVPLYEPEDNDMFNVSRIEVGFKWFF